MKKLSRLFILSALIAFGSLKVSAQSPYNMSIGGIMGNMFGASFKMFFSDHFAFQTDLGVKVSRGWGLEVNPNLKYQGDIYSWGFGSMYWFAGGGLSLGYHFNNSGKFGINSIGGVELAFNTIPLTVQFDFRPGYGLLFAPDYHPSFFDWTLGLSARYTF